MRIFDLEGTPAPLRWALYVVVFTYVVNFVFLGSAVSPWDYDHLGSYYELAWRFWATSKSWLPSYNPYFCGGRTLGGDPQIPIFHPFAFLVSFVSPVLLIKLEMIAQLLLGTWGLVGLCRNFRVPRHSIPWGVFVFLAGGGVVSRFMVGHVTLGFYFLYPLFFFLSYRLSELDGNRRNRMLGWYWLLFIYSGLYKPNFLIYGVPPLAIEVLVRSFLRKDAKPILWFGLGVVFSAGVAAVSLLPAWKYFGDFPRPDDSPTRPIPLYTFLVNLVFPLKTLPEIAYGPLYLQRHEYNNFVGPVALLFSWWGLKELIRARREEGYALLAFAAMSIWLGLGASGSSIAIDSSYSWLRSFWPGFRSIRVPPRFWFSAFLLISLASAAGFRAPKTIPQRAAFLILGILLLMGNAVVNLFKTSLTADAAYQPLARAARDYPDDIVWVRGGPFAHLGNVRRGIGVLDCSDNMEVFRAPDLEERSLLGAKSERSARIDAKWLDWGAIAVEANGEPPLAFSLNLNHSPYWRFEGTGADISSKLGSRLALHSPEARLSGRLVFHQPFVVESLTISAVSALLFLGFMIWAFSRRVI